MRSFRGEKRLRGTDESDAVEELSIQRPRLRRKPKRIDEGDREMLKTLIRDIPNFIRLLGRLARDPRVSRVDKALVVATIGYLLMPMDLIPDFIPFLGQMDDIFLLALALDRLLNNAGIDVLLDHWSGQSVSLEIVISALDKAGALLPDRVRGILYERVR